MKDRFRTKYGIFPSDPEPSTNQGSLSSSLHTDSPVLSRLDQSFEEIPQLSTLPEDLSNDLSHILPSVLKVTLHTQERCLKNIVKFDYAKEYSCEGIKVNFSCSSHEWDNYISPISPIPFCFWWPTISRGNWSYSELVCRPNIQEVFLADRLLK